MHGYRVFVRGLPFVVFAHDVLAAARVAWLHYRTLSGE